MAGTSREERRKQRELEEGRKVRHHSSCASYTRLSISGYSSDASCVTYAWKAALFFVVFLERASTTRGRRDDGDANA